MNYKMTTPCKECPFLIGSGFVYSNLSRHASGEFGCHKACDLDEDTGNFEPHEKTPHCAGALILLERKLKRVNRGVCPECNRTFANLARHMACKHESAK